MPLLRQALSGGSAVQAERAAGLRLRISRVIAHFTEPDAVAFGYVEEAVKVAILAAVVALDTSRFSQPRVIRWSGRMLRNSCRELRRCPSWPREQVLHPVGSRFTPSSAMVQPRQLRPAGEAGTSGPQPQLNPREAGAGTFGAAEMLSGNSIESIWNRATSSSSPGTHHDS